MHSMLLGIAGGSGSGKTTLARAVCDHCPEPTASLAFDSYYRDQGHRPHHERAQVNYDHPDSLDVERFIADLWSLRNGVGVAAPVYDFATHTRADDVQLVEPRPVVVVDGILLLVFPEVRELLDLSVFVSVDTALRIDRRVQRDVAERGRTAEQALEQISRTVQPMHDAFVEPTRTAADMVVDGTAPVEQGANAVLRQLLAAAQQSAEQTTALESTTG